MGTENQDKLKYAGVTPHIAFFLEQLSKYPQSYVSADSRRGGLSVKGETWYSAILRGRMEPLLERVREDPVISEQAQQFRGSIKPESTQGTCSYSLSEEEREHFLQFVENNGCDLEDFLQKIISTRLII